jgi:hypothetical protein
MSNNIVPQKLCIYFSYPGLVNGSAGNISSASAVFSQYDQVVFGTGLEEIAHPDHANTVAIIASLPDTIFFGYIDSTLPLDTIQTKIDLWKDMGCKGIFCDRFGYDFGLIRAVQRSIIWSVHAAKLKAFVNCWNPDDAFSNIAVPYNNPDGLVTRLGYNDWYLAESFAVINGSYDDADADSNGVKDFQDKAAKMVAYRTTYGTKMAAVATLGSVPFTQNLADYSYYIAALNKFESWAMGEEYYSASSASLPYRTRALFYGTKFTSGVTAVDGKLERKTNIGLHVDTNTHTINTLLD